MSSAGLFSSGPPPIRGPSDAHRGRGRGQFRGRGRGQFRGRGRGGGNVRVGGGRGPRGVASSSTLSSALRDRQGHGAGVLGPSAKARVGMGERKSASALTIRDLAQDELFLLAQRYWPSERSTRVYDTCSEEEPPASRIEEEEEEEEEEKKKAGNSTNTRSSGGRGGEVVFDALLVLDIYKRRMGDLDPQRMMVLEYSQYLERYLWPNFSADTSGFEHIMSIVLMIVEKCREGVAAWDVVCSDPTKFHAFLLRLLCLWEERGNQWTMRERVYYLIFFIRLFSTLENDVLRRQTMRLCSLPLWTNLPTSRLEMELLRSPEVIVKAWKSYRKSLEKSSHVTDVSGRMEREFLVGMISHFLEVVESLPQKGADRVSISYVEHFVEFLVDLMASYSTRRFLYALTSSMHVLTRCRGAAFFSSDQARLFRQMLEILDFYIGFEVDELTGEQLPLEVMVHRHSEKLQTLQRVAYKYFREELFELAMANLSALDNREGLLKYLQPLPDSRLRNLCEVLRLLPSQTEDSVIEPRGFLEDILVLHFRKYASQLAEVQNIVLYPDETEIWDEKLVPKLRLSSNQVLALPKLNLQFLTVHDYLLRNFQLFRLESTYEIREDIENCLQRMMPRLGHDGEQVFMGWSRYALSIDRFQITGVKKPDVGESVPAMVTAQLELNLEGLKGPIRREWEELKQHDVLFLVTIYCEHRIDDSIDPKIPFKDQVGLKYIRGAEIVDVRDSAGTVFTGLGDSVAHSLAGDFRRINLLLDPAQYQRDVSSGKSDEVWNSFSLVIRRKPNENNFKPVLETIRDLMRSSTVVPSWLSNILLGLNDPQSGHFSRLVDRVVPHVDFKDTFLDFEHIQDSFSDCDIEFIDNAPHLQSRKPFRVTYPRVEVPNHGKDSSVSSENLLSKMIVEAYDPSNPGPYPEDQPRLNHVRFTSSQVKAISDAMQPGLHMVVGPPGTGKTDVAVQIVSNLYHNFPNQKILLVTHSNQALNDLFEKIATKDIDERYLLRLGHGEQDLRLGKDFSKFGRVQYILNRRIRLLEDVTQLATSIDLPDDFGYSCETASLFRTQHIQAEIEKFRDALSKVNFVENPSCVRDMFPFLRFFSDVPNLFSGTDAQQDLETAEGCIRHIDRIFKELEDYQAFELLRNYHDRTNYLLTKHARIIAMTCTHAALKRRDFVASGFQFDNLVMEEAAQVLEIETFIPILLQNPNFGVDRLRRVILIGDHNQLPPVVKNLPIQKYAHLDQSMFTRFVRLGVPFTLLDCQGRMRPSLASLYRWRYKGLHDLPTVHLDPAFSWSNAGFEFDYQFIDVGDYQGHGEMEPNAYFYQNLGEAEYVVAMFMYMRLLGYPAHRISILTPYNGQRELILDVLKHRCAWNPLFGIPARVATVDQFQGQQNDYILLSMVRTKNIGHIRDVRRLVVAMSRARLGLYIFGRLNLFSNCFELKPSFRLLESRPTRLRLVRAEMFPTRRQLDDEVDESLLVEVDNVEEMGQVVQALIAECAAQLDLSAAEHQQLHDAATFDGSVIEDSEEQAFEMDSRAEDGNVGHEEEEVEENGTDYSFFDAQEEVD